MSNPDNEREEFAKVRAAVWRSARGDAPSPRAVKRTMAALGLGVVASTSTASAATAASQLGKLGIWKWFGIGVVAGGTAIGSYEATMPLAETPLSQPAASASVAPVARHVAARSSATSSPEPNPSANPTAISVPSIVVPPPLPPTMLSEEVGEHDDAPAIAPTGPGTKLEAEVAAIDEARSALGAGDINRCMLLLDRHDRDFAVPQLGWEAAVLRLEALIRRGDCAAARALADRLLATPSSQEMRIRTMMSGCPGAHPR